MSGSTLAYSTTTGQRRTDPGRRNEVALGGIIIELMLEDNRVRIGDVLLHVTYLDDDSFDGYVARFEVTCTHKRGKGEKTVSYEFTIYDDRVRVVDKVSQYEDDRPSLFGADERTLSTMRAFLHYVQNKMCECRRTSSA